MNNYLATNKAAFDALAPQYDARWRKYLGHQEKVLKPFEDLLREQFHGQVKVLDIGCGVGLDSYILVQHGFEVHAIDFSEKSVAYAKRNVLAAKVRAGDFLSEKFEEKFHGVVLDAFLHLFPKKDVHLVFDKVKSVLAPRGVGLICTTQSHESKEGYFEKADYAGRVKRFRKFWTQHELIETLEGAGFKILKIYLSENKPFNKTWFNVIFKLV